MARYDSQPSGVLRASVSASKASHRSRSWRSSALTWSKAAYLSRAWSSSSCHQQVRTCKHHDARIARRDEKKKETSNDAPPGRRATRGRRGPSAPHSTLGRAWRRGCGALPITPAPLGVGERRRVTRDPLYLGGAAGTGRRGLGTMPSAPATMWPSRRLTRAPSWDSGESVGKLTHWSHPGGGESSSGISTTTAREPPVGAGPYAASVDASTCASVAAGSRRGHRFRQRPHDHGRPTALLRCRRWLRLHRDRRSGLRLHHDRRRRLRLHHGRRRGLHLRHDRRPPLLDSRRLRRGGMIRRLWPRGLSRALRALARRGRCTRPRPRHP
jgi:hypothetical protein